MEHLVIYFYKLNNDVGIGRINANFRNNPPTMTDICDIEKELKEKFNFNHVCIINWKLLSEE